MRVIAIFFFTRKNIVPLGGGLYGSFRFVDDMQKNTGRTHFGSPGGADPREAHAKGLASRRRNKLARDILARELLVRVETTNGMRATKKELGLRKLATMFAKGDLEAIRLALKILGEDVVDKIVVVPDIQVLDFGE